MSLVNGHASGHDIFPIEEPGVSTVQSELDSWNRRIRESREKIKRYRKRIERLREQDPVRNQEVIRFLDEQIARSQNEIECWQSGLKIIKAALKKWQKEEEAIDAELSRIPREDPELWSLTVSDAHNLLPDEIARYGEKSPQGVSDRRDEISRWIYHRMLSDKIRQIVKNRIRADKFASPCKQFVGQGCTFAEAFQQATWQIWGGFKFSSDRPAGCKIVYLHYMEGNDCQTGRTITLEMEDHFEDE